jgi:hypothetical protein
MLIILKKKIIYMEEAINKLGNYSVPIKGKIGTISIERKL